MASARVTRSLFLGAIVTLGCGPSFQAVYECNVRFEHCYAVDMSVGPSDGKKDCWREWLHDYTYGQSSDRVEYAATRFSELSLDSTLPTLDTDNRPKRPRASATAPIPTNAFVPPPNVAESASAPASPTPAPNPVVAAVAPLPARAPGEECTSRCTDTWSSCHRRCKDGACDTCDRSYKSCVPACFGPETRQPARSLR